MRVKKMTYPELKKKIAGPISNKKSVKEFLGISLNHHHGSFNGKEHNSIYKGPEQEWP